MEDVIVYSSGIVSLSACASNKLSIEEITKEVNTLMPTGIASKWELSKDTHFTDGIHTNPCECDQERTTRKHYLFNC